VTAPLTTPAEARAFIRYDWLQTRTGNNLHAPAPDLPDDVAVGIVEDGYARAPLACGIYADVCIPGYFSRGALSGVPRCARCCKALGYPGGAGSPKNSALCRVILGLPADGGAG